MSEPRTCAVEIREPLPGILHWTVHDDRLDFRSDAYAVLRQGTVVLIDPLPLRQDLTDALGDVAAVCITGGFHQRSCWRFRRRFGAPVYAPAGASGLLEAPDETYGDPARLPGGLFASMRAGPTQPHFVFACEIDSGERVLFCGDLLVGEENGRLRLVEDAYLDDARATRRAVESLLGLEPTHLCPAHGAPVIGKATDSIRSVVEGFGRPGPP